MLKCQLLCRTWRCEHDDFVASALVDRGSQFNGIGLRATYFETVSEYEYFHSPGTAYEVAPENANPAVGQDRIDNPSRRATPASASAPGRSCMPPASRTPSLNVA